MIQEYAFDVELAAVVRVKAQSLNDALNLVQTGIQEIDINVETEGGMITEVSVFGRPKLFEVAGEETTENVIRRASCGCPKSTDGQASEVSQPV